MGLETKLVRSKLVELEKLNLQGHQYSKSLFVAKMDLANVLTSLGGTGGASPVC